MKTVILAGGKGTRMGNLTVDIPKPMIKIGGKPILQHQVENAKRYGFSDLIMLIGYKEEIVREYFGSGEKFGVKIEYISEPKPLGTSGAVKQIESVINEPFIVLYGDTMMDINLANLVEYHQSKKGIATLVVHPNDHPYDSDLMDVDSTNRVKRIISKPHDPNQNYRNLVNAALYILAPEIFRYIEQGVFSDFGKDILPRVLANGEFITAYNTTEYIKDVGTPERLEEVIGDYQSGKITKRNSTFKQKAIFLDRDGVINYEGDIVDKPEKFRFLPGVPEAIKAINKSDYLAVVVTNQPIIAKGFASEEQVQEVHNYFETLLGQRSAYVDRIYYCPHHPERGHIGERKEYKISCICRKPAIGMIESAVSDMNIDLSESYIIGDQTVDIMTGINANIKTILIREGFAGSDKKYDCTPNYEFKNISEAVQYILVKNVS